MANKLTNTTFLNLLFNIIIIWSLSYSVQSIPTYVCNENGKTVYQSFPCANAAKLPAKVQKHTKEQDLIVFSRQGNEASMYNLLAQGISPNVVDQKGNSPLFYALRQQYYNIARLLITANADVNHILTSGASLLIFFANRGELQTLQLLLTNKVNIDYQTTTEGNTALLSATIANKTSAVKLLLKSGADPNIANNAGITPLIAALQNKATKVISVLLQYHANIDQLSRPKNKEFGSTPLIHFATNGDQENILLLLKFGANVNLANEKHISPLTAAALVGNLDMVKLLLIAGANPKQLTTEPLFWDYVKSKNDPQIAAIITETLNAHKDDK